MATNRRMVQLKGPDFYPTPAWATRALLSKETFDRTVLEPCCGDGAIARELVRAGYTTYAYDLHDRGYGDEQRNAFTEWRRVSNIVTNPPFNLANELLAHWYPLVKCKLVLLLRTAFLESKRRFALFEEHAPPSRVYVFTERLSMYPAGQPVQGGGTTSYSWFVWDKTHDGPTTLHWIEPGWKPKSKPAARVQPVSSRVHRSRDVVTPRRRALARASPE